MFGGDLGTEGSHPMFLFLILVTAAQVSSAALHVRNLLSLWLMTWCGCVWRDTQGQGRLFPGRQGGVLPLLQSLQAGGRCGQVNIWGGRAARRDPPAAGMLWAAALNPALLCALCLSNPMSPKVQGSFNLEKEWTGFLKATVQVAVPGNSWAWL